ncbi:MAG TPA: PAS domain S-box protein, partial [Chloroflexota bacterium]|nr:PAS domain S-box protein [Chloroflexota bacterium]
MTAGLPSGMGEATLRAVWEAASDAIALSDPDGLVLAVNPAYLSLYGFALDEVLGRSFALIFPAADRTSAEEQYRQVFRSPTDPPPFRSVVRRRDGSEHVVEARASFLIEGGRRVAMLSIVRDVTAEVTAQRDAAVAQREQRALLSSLSHDIKSPLTTIRGHAQVLRRHVERRGDAPPPDRLVAGLALIEASALRLAG